MARRILFVCLHGSAKSLTAAEYFQRLAAQRGLEVRVSSAGIHPDPDVPAHVVQGLLGDGIDVRGRRPSPVSREELANAWRVVSFGCDLGPMAPPGLAVERWDDVPAVSQDWSAARDAILGRLGPLLAECEGPPG